MTLKLVFDSVQLVLVHYLYKTDFFTYRSEGLLASNLKS